MFLLFTGFRWSPLGGWKDYCGVFESVEKALLYTTEYWQEGLVSYFYQIVDSETLTVVKEDWGVPEDGCLGLSCVED